MSALQTLGVVWLVSLAAGVGLAEYRHARRRRPSIEVGFARIIAGQVAVGLMRNAEPNALVEVGSAAWADEMEQASMRARSCLSVIGLMIANASQRDDDVMAILNTTEATFTLQPKARTGHPAEEAAPWPTDIGFDGA